VAPSVPPLQGQGFKLPNAVPLRVASREHRSMPELQTILPFLGLAAIAALADVVGGLIMLRRRPGMYDPRYIIAFSSGIVVATAFFELIPEADIAQNTFIFATGFFSFYLAEKFVMLHSCEEPECETHEPSWVAVGGMAADNIVDGIGIAIGFTVDPILGLTITLAVVAHEVPQGMTSAQILRGLPLTPKRIVQLVALAGSMYVVGAFLSLFIPSSYYTATIAFVAGAFIYVGAGDLLAEAHRRFNIKVIAAVVAGSVLMLALSSLEAA